MGYYTKFWLTVEQGEADFEQVYERLTKIVVPDAPEGASPFYHEADSDQISSDDTMKWYDHDEDCAELSKMFPNVTFCLYGEGEENSDSWKTYYKNGLCQISRGVITYAPYDPTKLKSVTQAQLMDEGR